MASGFVGLGFVVSEPVDGKDEHVEVKSFQEDGARQTFESSLRPVTKHVLHGRNLSIKGN